MKEQAQGFDEHDLIHKLQHYLPSQNPIKDFVHHNSLHSFQEFSFHEAIHRGSVIMGYKGYLMLSEYRELYASNAITDDSIDYVIRQHYGDEAVDEMREKMLRVEYDENIQQRVGGLRNQWRSKLRVNLDKQVFPVLFRLISNYLDQGVSVWHFPIVDKGFLEAIKQIESNTVESLFKTERVRELLFSGDLTMTSLLKLIVGEERYFERYVFDQQFCHPGWSGMVAVLEQDPGLLYESRGIKLSDFIIVELLLELDALYYNYNDMWSPLAYKAELDDVDLFADLESSELFDVFKLWLEAYEWTYYHEVLSGLRLSAEQAGAEEDSGAGEVRDQAPSFQCFCCIDDREISFRRHLEAVDEECETFGTPGHFGVVAYYKPAKGHFLTKICPAPLNPKHVLKEVYEDKTIDRDAHFHKRTHSILSGWVLSQTLGFLSGVKLLKMLFSPNYSAATYSVFHHIHEDATLQLDFDSSQKEGDYRVGFTVDEMADIVASILKTTGWSGKFANLVYFVGHGASSTNNPYYAGYGCGACMGRPGSANARAAAKMANRPEVRAKLEQRGVRIPVGTWFVGGLHDTTRDDIAFYNEAQIPAELQSQHKKNLEVFDQALVNNAKERARRFGNIPLGLSKAATMKRVKERSVRFFEIRPEYNHATNTLFVVGRRSITKNLFLDRRAFLNSYDYRRDPDGKLLADILNAGAGVCAGINLEYYFSRVDTHRLGAGSKLPQNIIGLIGVANGVEGDLRTGLPYQMVEIHDPLRLMTVIEQEPQVVQSMLQDNEDVRQWYFNGWMNLVVMNPVDMKMYVYREGEFVAYERPAQDIGTVDNVEAATSASRQNLPVLLIK